MAAWVMDLGSINAYGDIIHYGQGDCDGKMFGLGKYSGKLVFWGGCKDFTTSLNFPANQWVFVAVVYDGTKVKVWINDQYQTADISGLYTTQSNLWIGAETINNGKNIRSYFKGLIDEAFIYNRALPDVEMLTIYNNKCNTCYRDADNDGFGAVNDFITDQCICPNGYLLDNSDCNDSNFKINTNAIEICDVIDNDCDGLIDEAAKSTFYRDADGDGYGDANYSVEDCLQPAGYAPNNTDCNDNDAAISPNAVEICDDGLDNDCNGLTELNGLFEFYRDQDNDGFGDPNNKISECFQPAGYVTNNSDCNDGDFFTNPSIVEFCDGLDNNCDGRPESPIFCQPPVEAVGFWPFDEKGGSVAYSKTSNVHGQKLKALPGQMVNMAPP
ncbi:MAG: hypothetical protein HZA78_02295 [Candidatus Schekmanbacteria bacterium]|nr:hypothetical protein [Candidatus Schekmanbacteria bacterium]